MSVAVGTNCTIKTEKQKRINTLSEERANFPEATTQLSSGLFFFRYFHHTVKPVESRQRITVTVGQGEAVASGGLFEIMAPPTEMATIQTTPWAMKNGNMP